MRTKLYVLGAVLGAAPGLPGALHAPEKKTPSRETRDAELRTRATGAPLHPCELITVVAVPCDASQATCEYTYWECPAAPHLLRV